MWSRIFTVTFLFLSYAVSK